MSLADLAVAGGSCGVWSRCSSLSRLVMNKCVPRQSPMNPLSCCLLPRCPCQASTTITLALLIRKPFKLRVVPGWCSVLRSGYSSDQQAVTAHRRSCSLQRGLILWFWLGCSRRYCGEEKGCSWQESGDGFKRLQWSFTWVQANLDKSHWIEGCTPALANGKCVVSFIVLSDQTVCCFKDFMI